MEPDDQEVKSYMQEFDEILPSIEQHILNLNKEQETKVLLEDILSYLEEMIPSSLLLDASVIGDMSDILRIKDFLCSYAKEWKDKRDDSKAQREEMRVQKAILDAKLTDLKKEIDSVFGECQQMETQLKSGDDLPLILRLMSSK